MLRTDLPIVRDLLGLGKALPADSRERQTIADAAEVLGACVEALEYINNQCNRVNSGEFDALGATQAVHHTVRPALADARRDYSAVVIPALEDHQR